jgi:hypothetical protein
MAERIMRDRYAVERIKPRTWKEKRTLLMFGGAVLASAFIVFGLHEMVRSSQRIREQHWVKAQGTIEDVRAVLVGQSGGYRSGMLYNEQVLVAYSMNGSTERRWITVSQPPTGRAGVDFDSRMWKGRRCLVLVNPKHSEQTAVEFLKQ